MFLPSDIMSLRQYLHSPHLFGRQAMETEQVLSILSAVSSLAARHRQEVRRAVRTGPGRCHGADRIVWSSGVVAVFGHCSLEVSKHHEVSIVVQPHPCQRTKAPTEHPTGPCQLTYIEHESAQARLRALSANGTYLSRAVAGQLRNL